MCKVSGRETGRKPVGDGWRTNGSQDGNSRVRSRNEVGRAGRAKGRGDLRDELIPSELELIPFEIWQGQGGECTCRGEGGE